MTPIEVTHDPMTVVGLDIRTSKTDEADPGTARIPELWGRVRAGGLEAIPATAGHTLPVAVYSDYRGARGVRDTGFAVGKVVEEDAPTPAGFARATIRAGTCLRFTAQGDMPRVVIETWAAVWDYFAGEDAREAARLHRGLRDHAAGSSPRAPCRSPSSAPAVPPGSP